MRKNHLLSGPVRIMLVGFATSWSTAAAYAACGMASVSGGGSGPPSISATETSTTQVLEEVRRRTEAATQPQPIPVSSTTPLPASTAAAEPPPAVKPAPAPAAAAKPAPKPEVADAVEEAAPAPKAKAVKKAKAPENAPDPQAAKEAAPKPKAVKKVQAAEPAAETYDAPPPSLKDFSSAEDRSIVGGLSRSTAVWAQGFADYERHSNLAPGNQENPTRRTFTGGGLAGADWTTVKHGDTVQALQFGVFGGYSASHTKLSDTNYQAQDTDGTPFTINYARTDNQQDIDGPFVGAYAAYVADRWTFDAAFKADIFDLSQSSTVAQTPVTCGGGSPDIGIQTGSASVTDYVFAVNAAYRHDLTPNSWFSPMVGIRYTVTNFSNDISNSVFASNTTLGTSQKAGTLGLDDGTALRLQVGGQYGRTWTSPEGYLWTTTLGAFLYSDVSITGFNSIAGQTGERVGPVDEGKVRALGQLQTRLDVGNRLSYMLQAEVRGGTDIFGVGGQVGIRYEW